jgi:hypothetical protein
MGDVDFCRRRCGLLLVRMGIGQSFQSRREPDETVPMPGAISEFLDAERVVVALRELQRGAREPGLTGGNVE